MPLHDAAVAHYMERSGMPLHDAAMAHYMERGGMPSHDAVGINCKKWHNY